jgi:hypothetical protein
LLQLSLRRTEDACDSDFRTPALNIKKHERNIFHSSPIDLPERNLGRSNNKLFMEVNNRGNKLFYGLNGSLPATANNPTTAADAGDAFLMNQGYILAWNGWDISAPPGGDRLLISVPVATNGGATITGPSYEYIVFDNSTTLSSTLAYAAATVDKSFAKLTVRQHLTDAPVTIPASGWEYTLSSGTAIRLLPAGTPFAQSAIYEFSYTAKNPLVAGLGLAATRDFLSFLRYATADDFGHANPLAGHVDHTYTFTVSQPARYGNDFQTLGFNEDEQGRPAIDGWALRAPAFGGPDGCESFGQWIPFKKTRAERLAIGDPRLSLEERYKNHDSYVKEVGKAADALEKRRLLLPADVQRYIDEAQASSVPQ